MPDKETNSMCRPGDCGPELPPPDGEGVKHVHHCPHGRVFVWGVGHEAGWQPMPVRGEPGWKPVEVADGALPVEWTRADLEKRIRMRNTTSRTGWQEDAEIGFLLAALDRARSEAAGLREALEVIASPDALVKANDEAFSGPAFRRAQEVARYALAKDYGDGQ